MRVAAEAFYFEIEIAGVEGVAQGGEGGAGPWKASMRSFQASHGKRSACFRVSGARSAAARTGAPLTDSRDLVPMVRIKARHRAISKLSIPWGRER
jgi:hypothetical protein